MKKIQRRIEDKTHDHIPNESKSEDGQWFFGFNEKGGNVLVKDVRLVVEDISRHKNVEFSFKIKEELLEDGKEMLKIISEIRKLHRTRLTCLSKVEKGKRFTEVRKLNELLKKIDLKDMTEDNDLFYL